MIEIVYDKKTAENDIKNNISYKMPKNIRQIGLAPDKKKIYIEDYVMTFLRKIAEPGNTTSRGAILLGEHFKDEDTETIFISGAIEAQNLEFDVEQIKFNDQVWSDLYADINKYFDKLSVVGWFLSRMGFSIAINDHIKKLHHDNFKTPGSVLFVMDSLECEDAFYMWEKNTLIKQYGYYIYYVRNEAMQNYIISRKNSSTEERDEAVIRKDAELVKSFREMQSGCKDKNQGQKNYFIYAASSFLMIFALSMGIVVSGSYDKMKKIENAVKKIETEKTGVQVFSDNSDNDYENIYEYTEAVASETDIIEAGTNLENKNGTTDITNEAADNEKTNQAAVDDMINDAVESMAENEEAGLVQEYIVEEGDTLMSISLKMYDSPDYVDNIMEANSIKEGDSIYPGQKITIPYIR